MTKQELLAMPNLKVDKIVKIKGSDYDRRIKLNAKARAAVIKSFGLGTPVVELADKYKVSLYTIRYTVDEEFRNSERVRIANVAKMFGPYISNSLITAEARGAYKKELVRQGKIKMKDIVA